MATPIVLPAYHGPEFVNTALLEIVADRGLHILHRGVLQTLGKTESMSALIENSGMSGDNSLNLQ